MKRSRKIWMLVIIALVNLAVILSFVFLTKRIRSDEKLRLDKTEIPAKSGDFVFYHSCNQTTIGIRLVKSV